MAGKVERCRLLMFSFLAFSSLEQRGFNALITIIIFRYRNDSDIIIKVLTIVFSFNIFISISYKRLLFSEKQSLNVNLENYVTQ